MKPSQYFLGFITVVGLLTLLVVFFFAHQSSVTNYAHTYDVALCGEPELAFLPTGPFYYGYDDSNVWKTPATYQHTPGTLWVRFGISDDIIFRPEHGADIEIK